MTANFIEPKEILRNVSSIIRMDVPVQQNEWSSWCAEFMRHVCSAYCPAPKRKILRAVKELLKQIVPSHLLEDEETEQIFDGLFLANDIIELSSFIIQKEEYEGDWIFVAPPSFTRYTPNRFHISGIAEDFYNFVPEALFPLLKRSGPHRFLDIEDPEQALRLLLACGLRELRPEFAIASPAIETAESYVKRATNKLSVANHPGSLGGLKVLFTRDQTVPYRDRWSEPTNESGYFVCRRPSAFGAERWCFAQLHKGDAIRLIDLPWIGDNGRGCDAAWRLQLALDASFGEQAVYRRFEKGRHLDIRFSFPIPLWAQQRLRLLTDDGTCTSMSAEGIPVAAWDAERRTFEQLLWLREK